MPDLLSVPQQRRESIERLAQELRAGRSVAISTHINADGDGCGSETALSRLLAQMGIRSRIVNPTPWPEMYKFLLGDDVRDASDLGAKALKEADVLIVLDISDVKRLGVLAEAVRGLGKAYLAGFAWALQRGYPLVLEMDADFSHNPKYLPRMLELAREADLVLGSRNVKGGGTVNWGLGRKMLSRGGSFYARTILGLRVRDLTGGFKCFRREVLEAIDLGSVECSGYAFQIELTYRTVKKGFQVVELPIVFEDRRVGKSKMSRKIFLEALSMVWRLRWWALVVVCLAMFMNALDSSIVNVAGDCVAAGGKIAGAKLRGGFGAVNFAAARAPAVG